ncbi:hypothetical protein TWF696_005028 [Orbilia brochopaga]|uniref:Uncharacterized protein n=1 Tax=Orbilia brochopaga TaxID=3140254 RepID=A0AAV9V2S5_9PEZI
MEPEEILSAIIAAIKGPREDQADLLMTFDNVTPANAELIHDTLNNELNQLERRRYKFSYNSAKETLSIVLPTGLHGCGMSWIASSIISWHLENLVPLSCRTDFAMMGRKTYKNFESPYQRSIKQADVVLERRNRGAGQGFQSLRHKQPILVLEVGWSEPWTQLQEDRELWSQGTEEPVVVILIKFFRSQSGTRGFVEVSSVRNEELVVQRKTIWPIPDEAQEDPYLLLGELYGNALPEGFDPSTRLPLLLSELRDWARDQLADIGLSSA